MKIILNQQEVLNAIAVYMALKGFDTDQKMRFSVDTKNEDISIEINVISKKFNIEDIRKYAEQN